MRTIFRRIAIVPFEFAIAILVLGSGLISVFHLGTTDPINTLLPTWEANLISVSFLLSGILMIFGISLASAAIESLGLWFLNAIILSRFVLYGHYFHYNEDFWLMGIFDLAIILAGVIRLRSIKSEHVLIKVKKDDTGDIFNSGQ